MGFNWREWWCFAWHRTLRVVRDYGRHQHVRCPKCGCEFGVHSDVRTVLPWRLIGADIERGYR